MTALIGGAGPDWIARQVPVPEPGHGQIMVRAHAVARNNANTSMLAAADPTSGGTAKEYQAGYEFTGEVTAVGDDVTTPAIGDRGMGTTPGSFAQYVLAVHRHTLPIPEVAGRQAAKGCSSTWSSATPGPSSPVAARATPVRPVQVFMRM
ncbi:hypothetical protein ABZ802_05675 [Streptomyces sp. NPDC047737]|uniref:alcohol dehydrogenase catalytic domain-containing protein n=1 Tax=Streptomyces sp. NPDC047737 TaxID=3155740 RepID=UPI0033D54CA6